MDNTDRIRGLRHSSGLRRGRLDRRAGVRLSRPLLALAALLAVLLPGVPAWAHNALAEANPAKNATLKKSPSEVKLRFLQKLDPKYTTITVSDAAKAKVETSAPKVDGATGSVTFAAPLTNGAYTVAYQVVSTDGHTVKGSYQFTVNDPAAVEPSSAPPSLPATTEPAPAATTAAAPTPSAVSDLVEKSEESSNSTLYGLIAGIVVVLAAGAAFLFIRRRKA
ncbi:copper resistance CopC family protein [Actinoplanes sp. NPDC026670]|uniref:copper resistance CopC family protein n=1 Tax=Actinoplanes sp. NPDC026670 TaxID=3154700 RepID=UPI0033D396C1